MRDKESEINSEPFEYTLSLIGRKWKMTILYWIDHYPNIRYGQLKAGIKGITHKMLSQQLKELQSDGIIIRGEYSEIPPKVEYCLLPKGESLMPILYEMCKWGHEHFLEKDNNGEKDK